MGLFSRKNVEADIFTDGGMVHRVDHFSVYTILVSTIISIGLIVLAILAIIS